MTNPNHRPDTLFAAGLLLLLLVSNVPLFLCMPITDDAALWSLHADVLLDGGLPYRDVLETNPPGTLWLMAAVRWLFGPSSIALRAVDLAAFGWVVWLLLQILKDGGVGPVGRMWTGALCLLFYFSISEWCHCQRDMWLMAPALAWLWLRGRQVQRIAHSSVSAGRVFGWACVEGLVLGAGIWIKPMVLVPAAVAWLAGTMWVRDWRRFACDALGLLLGGLAMGTASGLWLVASGVWPYFWETFLEWNPRYVVAGKEHWTLHRFAGMCLRLFPWLLLHVPAVGLVAAGVLRGRRLVPRERMPAPVAGPPVAVLAGAFYVGWLIQALALQHLFDYVHAPGVLLAILTCGVVAGSRPAGRPAARVGWIAFAVVALLVSPAARWSRLACWADCLRHGSSVEVRDRLTLMQFPAWPDLEQVAGYLRERGVRDGEVCCFPNSTIHLYEMLGVRPPTRYVYLENTLAFFPERREVLRAALAAAAPKYAVTDLIAAGLPPEVLPRVRPGIVLSRLQADTGDPARVFPWGFPIEFRAGRYGVHRIRGPIGNLELIPVPPPPPRQPAGGLSQHDNQRAIDPNAGAPRRGSRM